MIVLICSNLGMGMCMWLFRFGCADVIVLICSDGFVLSGGWWMGLLFWVCGWGCLLIVAVGLGFACHEFGFCSQWWGLWVAAFGVDGGLMLVYPLLFFFFFGVSGGLWIFVGC